MSLFFSLGWEDKSLRERERGYCFSCEAKAEVAVRVWACQLLAGSMEALNWGVEFTWITQGDPV